MIDIISGIVCFNIILILFKLLDRYGIDNLQAICFNYITAGSLSFFLTSKTYSISEIIQSDWFFLAAGIGILFIVVFNLLALGAQKIGMAISTVANKMSVVIPVTVAVLLFGDTVSILKIIGIILALAGVFFTCRSGAGLSFDKKYLWLILIIFFGQGLADSFFNIAQNFYVTKEDLGIFFCVIFGSAGILGLIMLTSRTFSKSTSLTNIEIRKNKIKFKNILGGIAIGVPNFLTLLFFFRALDSGQLESSQVTPIFNIGVVVLSALTGFLLFKEKLSASNWIGISLSVLAIVAIGFG